MTDGQRRVFWGCIFAMTYIFYYEASGLALIYSSNDLPYMDSTLSRAHFWEQFGYGSIFLVLGTVLSVLFHRHRSASELPMRYLIWDWIALAVGLGILAGTVWRSFQSAGFENGFDG